MCQILKMNQTILVKTVPVVMEYVMLITKTGQKLMAELIFWVENQLQNGHIKVCNLKFETKSVLYILSFLCLCCDK